MAKRERTSLCRRARGITSPEEIAIIRQWIDGGAPAPLRRKSPRDLPGIAAKDCTAWRGERAVQSLAWFAPVKLVVAGGYGNVRLLEPNGLAVVREMGGIAGKVNAVAFSADGAFMSLLRQGMPASVEWRISGRRSMGPW